MNVVSLPSEGPRTKPRIDELEALLQLQRGQQKVAGTGWGRSVAVAHLVYTEAVTGSNPVAPTIFQYRGDQSGVVAWCRQGRRFAQRTKATSTAAK